MGQYNWAIKLLEQQTMQKDEKITPQLGHLASKQSLY